MDPVIGRALTVLAAAAVYAVAYLFREQPALVTVLTNVGTGLLATMVTGAGQVTTGTAERMVKAAASLPPPSDK